MKNNCWEKLQVTLTEHNYLFKDGRQHILFVSFRLFRQPRRSGSRCQIQYPVDIKYINSIQKSTKLHKNTYLAIHIYNLFTIEIIQLIKLD